MICAVGGERDGIKDNCSSAHKLREVVGSWKLENPFVPL
jgi:hypothetical protein